jgi:hypothetical protein
VLRGGSDELCINSKGGRNNEEEEGDKHEPEPVPSFIEVHSTF